VAQEDNYHPIISETFTVSIGAMRSSNSFKAFANSPGDLGDDIDFDDTLAVSDSSTYINGHLRWNFGKTKKWSLWGQYFSNNADGSATLTEDIEWDGLTFNEGTFVQSGVNLAVTRVFVGRSYIKNKQNDFGLGFGLHNLDMSFHIGGEVIINDETTGYQEAAVGASQVLPNIGAWYYFSPAKRWLLHTRVDWISANIGDYDGGLWNISAGVNYQAFKHVGFSFYWQYFNLHLKVDKTDWVGGTKMTYNGPVLSITFGW